MTYLLEQWKPVVGYESLYSVSNTGTVRSELRVVPMRDGRTKTVPERHLRPAPNLRGYLTVALCRDGVPKSFPVHTLVALSFLGSRPVAFDICHNDGGKSNSRLSNLRYGTRQDNQHDRVLHGTMSWGESHGSAKLTEQDVAAIRAEGKNTPTRVLAQKYGLNRNYVQSIIARRAWKHVP